MEVIKPMDFSSFTAFCEHLDKSAKATATTTTTATTAALAAAATALPTPAATSTSTTISAPYQNGNICFEKMERQGKMEMAAKERESQRLQSIPKKWNRREEYEFLRVLTGYGVDLQPPTTMGSTLAPDWTKFKQMAHLERKSDETLSDYYKVFTVMCKRQAGVKLSESERGLEGIIEDISEDHAKLILDRLELLGKLREVSRHPQLEERLKLCIMSADTPDWWEPGRHDKELVSAVLKHGLYRSETFIFNDPNFSFAESEKRFIRELEAQIKRTIKLEAFNAERAPTTAPSVKDEVIDLDDELLTKDSLIKKEQYTPVKAEVKVEQAPDTEQAREAKADGAADGSISSVDLTEKSGDDDAAMNTVGVAESDVSKEKKVDAEVTNMKPEEEKSVEAEEMVEKTIEEVTKLSAEETVRNEKKKDASEEADKTTEQESEKSAEVEAKRCEAKMDTDEAVADKAEKSMEDESAEEKPAVNDVDAKEESDIDKAELSEKSDGEPESRAENGDDKMETSLEDDTPKETDAESAEKKALPEKTPVSAEVVEGESGTEKQESPAEEQEAENSIKELKDQSKSAEPLSKDVEVTKESAAVAVAEKAKSTPDEEILDLAAGTTDPDDDEVMKEKEKAVEEECKKQAAELKARFPDLEVIQPATVKQKLEKPKLEMCMIRWFKDFALERRIAHIVTCVETNKWPVDKHYSAYTGCKGIDLNICLHEAIPHLNTIERRSTTPDVITITTDQGVTKHLQASQMQQVAAGASTAAAVGVAGANKSTVSSVDASINAAVAAAVAAVSNSNNNSNSLPPLLPGMSMTPATALSSTPTPSIPAPAPSSNVGKKRKRHIAIDVETERAKLHALLNSSQGMGPKDWETEIANMEALSAPATPSARRSATATVSQAPSAAALNTLQPPPAHQHAPLSRQSSGQFNKPAIPPLKTPPPSMGAPMDLSSSLPKLNMADMLKSASSAGAIDLSEVQDFSMSSKKASASNLHASLSSAFPSMSSGKSKLDDTLNKLMKKNNCTIEEPVIGKEKKRKKLDEIVLGLSAAKEQKTFPDPSLPSSKKPQIPPSVSVTPANLPSPMSSQSQQNQKPFTITVTTVPGKSKGSSSMPTAGASTSATSSKSGFSALQDLQLCSKEALATLMAQSMSADPQAFIKQQQRMMAGLSPAQRKSYEAMLAEMEQAIKMSKYSTHDVKVNKWLSDTCSPMGDQLSMDFANASSSANVNANTSSGSSRRSNRQQGGNSSQQSAAAQMSKAASQSAQAQSHAQHQQQQQQHSMVGPQGLTGEEPVPVINKQTGKRLTGNKAPQLKRLMPWLTENPAYEVDPKWLEQIQNPMSAPSPKPMDSGYAPSSKSHGGRQSSTPSNAPSSSHMQQQQQQQQQSTSAQSSSSGSSKKSSRQSAIDQANAALQFGSLAGLNPNLLASLPGLGSFDPKNPLSAFDPKNPLLSMPFAGMSGMGNIPGLGNLNSMNLFASLAGMGGLGNLASMDAQSLAALMAAAGPALSGLGGTGTGSSTGAGKGSSQSSSSSSKKNKNDAQQNVANMGMGSGAGSGGNIGGGANSSSNKNAAASASQLAAAGFPFLFPNPSLLYPPMGLGGLNPYSLGSTGLGSAYDQLAQQYNLLNGGGATSSAGTSSTTQSKSHQSQSKSSNSRSSASSSASVANLMSAMANMGGGGQATGASTSSSQSTRGGGRQSAASRAAAQASAEMAQLSSLLMPGADPHLLESLTRMDLAQTTRLMNSLGMPPVSSAPTTSTMSDKRSSSSASSLAAAQAAQEKQAAKEQQKWMESFARGALPSDLATLQAFSQGKFPTSLTSSQPVPLSSSSTASSSKSAAKAAAAAAAAAAAQLQQIPGLPSDFSQAFIADLAQAMASGTLPLSGPGSLASITGSLTGLATPSTSSASSVGGGSSSNAAKRQREQDALAKDAFKQQMDYYTKALGLGSNISLIPTSVASSSSPMSSSVAMSDDHHKPKRSRGDTHSSLASAKDDLAAAVLAGGLPLNLGGGMTSIEKSLRSGSMSSGLPEADKVTLTPLNSAGIAANLPSQTTITIAPPISSGASSSSERSERSESRISLTITNAADAAKLPPPYEEADELIIQPILKKPSQATPTSTAPATGSGHAGGSGEDASAAAANNVGGSSTSTAAAAAAAAEENRRSSSRLKRPRSGVDHSLTEQPPEKRRELRSTRHTRQSGGLDTSLNLSTGSEAEDKNE